MAEAPSDFQWKGTVMEEKFNVSRRRFVQLGAGAAAALGAFGLVGCGSGGTKGAAQGTSTASTAAAAKTRMITDLRGDEVEVPVEINKIADLWHAHNQIVLMLGGAPKLVGTTENFKKQAWANVVYPDIANVETLVVGSGAGEVNYEEALKLEPDVCFASDAGVTDTGRQQGLCVVNVMFQDYEGLRNDVKLTAEVLGGEAPAIAAAWEDFLNANIDLVAQRMQGVPEEDRVKVLHIVNKSSLTKVDGTNCIVDEWIKLAGGVNAIQMEGNMIEVTMEDIVAADPQVIIIGSGALDAVETILSDEAWSGITAVKNGAVYANPNGVFPWDRYSGEEALQVLWAAKKLNPEKFEDVDMAQTTKDFYKTFYGFELTDDQANRIINAQNPA